MMVVIRGVDVLLSAVEMLGQVTEWEQMQIVVHYLAEVFDPPAISTVNG